MVEMTLMRSPLVRVESHYSGSPVGILVRLAAADNPASHRRNGPRVTLVNELLHSAEPSRLPRVHEVAESLDSVLTLWKNERIIHLKP